MTPEEKKEIDSMFRFANMQLEETKRNLGFYSGATWDETFQNNKLYQLESEANIWEWVIGRLNKLKELK